MEQQEIRSLNNSKSMICILTFSSVEDKESVSDLTVKNLRIKKTIPDCANSVAYKKDCPQ